ncbi:MAG: hypothetical protein LC781_18435 [Actinobacteria bacterium]|nr:hypothetical protein [Actinomycetota bacterium]
MNGEVIALDGGGIFYVGNQRTQRVGLSLDSGDGLHLLGGVKLSSG